jgi:hypothetical protein
MTGFVVLVLLLALGSVLFGGILFCSYKALRAHDDDD